VLHVKGYVSGKIGVPMPVDTGDHVIQWAREMATAALTIPPSEQTSSQEQFGTTIHPLMLPNGPTGSAFVLPSLIGSGKSHL